MQKNYRYSDSAHFVKYFLSTNSEKFLTKDIILW